MNVMLMLKAVEDSTPLPILLLWDSKQNTQYVLRDCEPLNMA